MAVESAMFVFEVVVGSVESYVESKHLIIRSEFGEVFSLSLKDPKMMNIVIPEPPPMPVQAGKKGKKGKKKKKPKPKKKGKKGKKKGKEPPPPPAPKIQAGQSILITSTADYLIQTMKNNPLQVSLWSKEDYLVLIGSAALNWDPAYYTYLEQIIKCEEPPPVTVDETYNVFQEDTARLMAKLAIQIKLTYLKDKVTTSFRCLSEDLNDKKYLYTGINDKLASYMCTLNTTEDAYAEHGDKVISKYSKDKPISYADYKNCPSTELPFSEEQYCCVGYGNQPPTSKYRAPETMPDIDFICDYVRKIILSCNDNMRMLTPRPTIKPRIRSTDMDRLCYCRETQWPDSQIAERFKKEVQSGICAICNNDPGNKDAARPPTLFDLSTMRGPCGRVDCRIAKDLRTFIEGLVEEDNKEIEVSKIVGPCGSTTCTLAEKIQDFIRQEGAFEEGKTMPGLSTQCACVKTMQDELEKEPECVEECDYECAGDDDSGSDNKKGGSKQVYAVYYFTVEYDFEKNSEGGSPKGSAGATPAHSAKGTPKGTPKGSPKASPKGSRSRSPNQSPRGSVKGSEKESKASTPSSPSGTSRSSFLKSGTAPGSSAASCNPSKYKFCDETCPTVQDEDIICTKKTCAIGSSKEGSEESSSDEDVKSCGEKINSCGVCPVEDASLADSDVIIDFDGIKNKCCVKSCNVAEKVQDFIIDGMKRRKFKYHPDDPDPCMCDCVCTLNFTRATTYCSLCGGYEALGEDMKDQPPHMMPHPCPIYHNLYDKENLKVPNPWPDEKKEQVSAKSSKKAVPSTDQNAADRTRKRKHKQKVKKVKQQKPSELTVQKVEKQKEDFHYPAVPKNMGWMWNAEDQLGMKYRPGWKPGAITKLLMQRYKLIKAGGDVLEKKKQARDREVRRSSRHKKPPVVAAAAVNKPMLIITKKQGEYVVQMEVLKQYPEERLIHQPPYEDKPPLIYTVCRTDEEKARVIMKRAKKEAKDLKRMNRFIQSTFRDRCQEICLKAYHQATGLLPMPNFNKPDCPCVTAQPTRGDDSEDEDECSCSEPEDESESDDDEWTVEFTPPNARWVGKVKNALTFTNNETQYSYLDYRVKLVDREGKPIPRFFKGPDGRQECSDLGGFWGPNDNWLEINKDGFIAPDNRWAPMNFTGPDGQMYSGEDGFFVDTGGRVYNIGVDGYIDKCNKWISYPRRMGVSEPGGGSGAGGNRGGSGKAPPSPAGGGTKSRTAPPAPAPAAKKPAVQAKPSPPPAKGGGFGGKAKTVMNLSYHTKHHQHRMPAHSLVDRTGFMDPKKLNKYREIMNDVEMYDYLRELRSPCKADRASNTPRKNVSPFTLQNRLWPVRKISTVRSLRTYNSSTSSHDTSALRSFAQGQAAQQAQGE